MAIDKGYNRIQSSNLDGTDLKNIITTQDTPLNPVDIALDKENQKIYWTNYRQNNIQVADKNGENIRVLIEGKGRPDGIVLSENRIFWSVVNEGKIKSATLTGADIQEVAKSIGYPQDVVTDKFTNQIYWIDFQNKIIERADYDGLNRETIISENAPIAAMDIDSENRKLYWTTLGTNAALYQANLDGSGIELVQEGIESGNGIVIYNQAQTTGIRVLPKQEIQTSPNPVQDILKLEVKDKAISTIAFSLFDLQGKQIIPTQKKDVLNNQAFLNLEGLINGIYMLHISTSKGELSKKIIKQ